VNLFVVTTLILCTGVLVATGLAVTVWNYRRAPGAKPMLAPFAANFAYLVLDDESRILVASRGTWICG